MPKTKMVSWDVSVVVLTVPPVTVTDVSLVILVMTSKPTPPVPSVMMLTVPPVLLRLGGHWRGGRPGCPPRGTRAFTLHENPNFALYGSGRRISNVALSLHFHTERREHSAVTARRSGLVDGAVPSSRRGPLAPIALRLRSLPSFPRPTFLPSSLR